MSENMTLEQAKARIAEQDVEIRMLAAGRAAQAAARASAAASAAGKKAMARSEFEAKPAAERRTLMLSGKFVLFDDRDV